MLQRLQEEQAHPGGRILGRAREEDEGKGTDGSQSALSSFLSSRSTSELPKAAAHLELVSDLGHKR